MNAFDFLFAASCFAALLALLAVRPALLILASNQALTLRALANIQRYGKPFTQQPVPDSVFSGANLSIAAVVFSITTLTTLIFAALPARRKAQPPGELPRLPGWLVRALTIYFTLLAFSQGTILTQAYTDPDRRFYNVNFGGGTAFLNSIFLYEVVRRTMTGELKRAYGFGTVFLLFLATDYLHGSTGLATGFVVVAAMLIFSVERAIRRSLVVASLLLSLAVLSLSIRVLRSTFASDAQGVSRVASTVRESNERERSNAEGVEGMGNGTQYAAHVLECITLYEAGETREWRSVYLPLIYTVEPSFLIGPLGLERPKEAAWELADYFIHGGGIFVVGELYWNGGYLCVAVVFFALALLCWRSDVSFHSGFVGLMMACHIGPNLLQGTGYGFAQVSRGVINGVMAVLLWAVARRLGIGSKMNNQHPVAI